MKVSTLLIKHFKLRFFLFSFLIGIPILSFGQTVTLNTVKHETLQQRQIIINYTAVAGATGLQFDSGPAILTDWVVRIGGTQVTTNSVIAVGLNVAVTFDATALNGVPNLLPGQTLTISYAGGTGVGKLRVLPGTNYAPTMTNQPSSNTWAGDCSDFTFFQQGDYAAPDICSPVVNNFKQFQYYMSLRLRNSSTFNIATKFRYSITWGDGTPSVSTGGYYSDNTGTANGAFYTSIPGFPSSVVTTRATKTFPDNTNVCSFTTSIFPVLLSVATCNSGSLVQTSTFISYDFDSENTGALSLQPAVANANRVCLGTNVGMQFSDNTKLNCVPDVPNIGSPNTLVRWIRFVYGFQNAPGPGNIPNVLVDGISVTNASGVITPAGGYFPTGAGGIGVPDGNGVIQLATPISTASATAFAKMITTSSTTNHAIGQRFYVRLDYWNTCNQYDGITATGQRSIDNYIEIVTKPTDPAPTNKQLCFDQDMSNGTAGGSSNVEPGACTVCFELTAASVTGKTEVKWYNSLADASGDANAISNFYGANSRFLRPSGKTGGIPNSLPAGGEYSIWARYRTGVSVPNNCLSSPVEVKITKRTELAQPGAFVTTSNKSPSDICNSSNTAIYEVPTTADNPLPGFPGTGTAEYQWIVTNTANVTQTDVTLTPIVGGKSVTATFNIPVATFGASPTVQRKIRVRRAYDNAPNCPSAYQDIVVTIYRQTAGGTITTDNTICNGSSTGTLTLSGHIGTVLGWERDFNGSNSFAPLGNAGSFTYSEIPGAPGTYRYRAVIRNGPTGQSYHCADVNSGMVTITVNPVPPKPTIGTSGATTFCFGGSVTLTSSNVGSLAAPANGYQWYKDGIAVSGQTSSSIVLSTVAQSGSYTVKVIGITPSNCESPFSDPTIVTINPLPSATVSGGGSACNGVAASDIVWTLTGTQPFNFTITSTPAQAGFPIMVTGHTLSTYTIVAPNPAVATNYEMTVLTDANTCPSASLGGIATVTPQAVAPPSNESFTAQAPVCDNGAGTNPPDAILDLLPNSIQNYAVSYQLKRVSTNSVLPGIISFTTSSDASGVINISPTYAQLGAFPTDPQGYQVIITALQNVTTGCAGAVPIPGPVLIVNAKPVITTQPIAAIQCSGLNTSFTVAATGTGLSYQWQEKINAGAFANLSDGTVGGITYAGSTSATLNISNVSAANTYNYQVIVTSFTGTTNCSVTSNVSTLTVNALPTVNSQTPQVCSTSGGGNTSTVDLTTQQVLIDGTAGRSFAWFENYNAISKVFSTAIASPSSFTITDGTPVFVRVTNTTTGCVSPATVTYTVNPKATITPLPATAIVCAGDLHNFVVTATGPGVNFKWQENSVDITDGTFGGVTYSGSTTSTLTVQNITSAKNGRNFRVVTTTTGSCVLNSNATTLTVNPLPVITNITPSPCSDIPGGTQALQNLNSYNTSVSAGAGVSTTVTWWLNYAAGVFTSQIPPGTGPGQVQAYTVSNGDQLFAKVVDNVTSCINVATANFTVKPVPFDNEIRDGSGTTIATVATSGAGFNLCASGSSILFQAVSSVNPGSTFAWSVAAVSYPNEFTLSGAVGKNVVFEFPNFTESNPASLYKVTGIPVTVIETLNGCPGNPVTIFVHVLNAPAAPVISGDQFVCDGAVATYSVPVIAGTTSYNWGLPPGAGFITAFPATASTISVQMSSFSGNVTLTTANAICPSPPSVPFPVVVSPNPVMTPIPQPVAVCSGETITSPKVTLASNVSGSTFNWKVLAVAGSITGVNPGDFANNVTDINQSPINISGVGASITYQVIPLSPDIDPFTAGVQSCSGSPLTFTVDVNPTPVLVTPQNKTICNGQSVNKEILLTPTNLPVGTSFTWPDPDGAGPATAKTVAMGVSGTLHITDILTNSTDNFITVTYMATPTNGNGSCVGLPLAIPIIVEPTPRVNTPVINGSPTICSGGAPDFTFSTLTTPTNPANLKFDVALTTLPSGVVATGLANTGVTDVSGSPSFQFTGGTLVNNNATNRTVVYTITPKLTGCAGGTPVTVSVEVEPTPVVTAINSSPKICDGGTPNFSINSTTVSSVPADLTYDIIPTIPAGITASGNALTGVTGILKSALPFGFTGGVLDNTTDARITVTYEIVPKLAGCANGPSQFVTVIVEPTPVANVPTNFAPIICHGGAPNFSFTTPTIPNTSADLTFDVTINTPLPTGISGTGAAISGVFGVSASAATAYVFNLGTLTNSSNSFQIVVYTITPKLNGCTNGPTQTVSVIVQPIPAANIPVNASAVICNGGTPNFSFTSPTVANTAGDVTFDVTLNTPLPSGVSGTGSALTGVFGVSADAVTAYVFNTGTLSNSSDGFKTVSYTITPKLNGCVNGSTRTVNIKIEPTPKADVPINSAPVICNGASVNFSFTSPTLTTTQSDLTFDIAASLPLPTGITGTNLTATGVTASAVTPYVFNTATLTNSGNVFQTVTFIITPQLNGCGSGPTRTVDVKVEPTPTFTFTNSPATICNGGTPNISVSSTTAPLTPSDLTFDVAVTLNGVTGTGVAVNGLTGTTAPFFINSGTLVNNFNTVKTVKYTVTPKLAGCPNGLPQDIFVVVEPTPAATFFNHSPRLCNGTSPNIEVNTLTVPSIPAALTFDVTVNLNGVTGTLDAGNGIVGASGPQFFINTGTLTNTTNSSKTVVYTITPKLGGCPSGPQQTVNVVVEPTPDATFTNISPTVCNGGTPNVLITSTTSPSNATDLTFNVVPVFPGNGFLTGTLRAGNGVTGATAPFSINTGVLTNTGNSFETVEYQITPLLNGCPSGTSQSVFVIVEPTPQADAPINHLPLICNNGTPNIEFTSPTTASVAANLTFDVSVITLPPGVSGSGEAVSGKSGATAPFFINTGSLTNSNTSFKTVVYRITPKLNGCTNGPVKTVSVDVEPTPAATFTNTKPTICSQDSPSITITSPTASSTPSDLKFDISVTAPAGISGTGVAFNGINNVSAGYVINSGMLVHDNLSNVPLTVVYTIIPRLVNGNLCADGTPVQVNVVVRPKPVGVSSTTIAPSEAVCSGQGFTYDIQGDNIDALGNQVASKFLFNVISSDETNVPTPVALNRTIATTAGIAGTFVNKTNADVFITYQVTPIDLSISACAGVPFDVVAVIHPEPKGALTTTIERCSGLQINYDLQTAIDDVGNGGNALANSQFTYALTSVLPSGNDLVPAAFPGNFGRDFASLSDLPILETFRNLTDHDVTITYSVTPYSDNPNRCVGTPFEFKVIYHPEPVGVDFPDPLCATTLNHDIQTQIVNNIPSEFIYTVSSDNGAVAAGPARIGFSNSPITDIYVNNSGVVANMTYTITARRVSADPAAQCMSTATPTTFKYIAQIFPTPIANGGPPLAATCSDNAFTLMPQSFVTNSVTITKYDWKVTYPAGLTGTLPASNTTTPNATGNITFTMTNKTAGSLNVTFEITPYASTCPGPTFTVVKPIDAEPVMSNSLNTSQCSGAAYGLNLATNGVYAAGTVTYDVYVDDVPAGLTGTRVVSATPIGGGNSSANVIFNDVYTNNTAAPLIVKYRIIPRGGGCEGDAKIIDFTVKPGPVLLVTSPPSMCSTNTNSPSITNIQLGTNGVSVNADRYRIDLIEYARKPVVGPMDPFTTSPSSPDFTFPASNKDVGNDGLIDLIKFDQFTNRTADPFVVRFTITPITGTCEGVAGTVSITVNPEPILDPALSPTPVCSGERVDPSGIAFALKSLATSVPSTLFIIRSINTNGVTPALTNASIGVQITKDGIDNDVFTNTVSSSFINVVYTITPISADGCMGVDQTVTVRVNPAPALKSGLDKIVCNGASSSIVLQDNSPTSAPASQYRLVGITVGPANTPITPGATAAGLTADAGNTSLNTTGSTTLISSDKYTNTTSDRIIVRYEIEAIAAISNCSATGFVTVTVEPAIISTSTPADTDICSSDAIAISFNTTSYASGDLTNPVLTYSYSMSYVAPATSGVTGNTIGNNLLKNPSGIDIQDVLINSKNEAIQVKYNITPRASAAAGGLGCAGAIQPIVITVQPRPKINPIPDKTVCEGEPINLNLVSPTTPGVGVIKFRLTSVVPETGAITGFTAANTLLTNTTLLADALSNTDTQQRYIDYTFEPVNVDAADATICANGIPITVRVTVNPRPGVTPSVSSIPVTALEICSSESIEINLPTDTDQSSTLVKWTALASSVDVVGESNGAGDILFQTLLNKGNAVQTVDYAITPSFNGCNGAVKHVIVTVNPIPTITLPTKKTVCGGESFILNLSSLANTAVGPTSFKWEVTDINGIGTSGQFDGTGVAINQAFVNNTDASATLLYQITPIFNGNAGKICEGIPKIINVSVAPTISAAFISTDEGICEGTPVFLTFELHGQSPFEFVYSAADINGTVNKTVTKSGNVKVDKVTPTITTAYEIVSVKDVFGCNVALSPKPKVTITVFQKVAAKWVANVPPFIGGTSAVGFTNTSTPIDASVFNYEWSFGTDNTPSPLTANGVGPFVVNYSRPGDHFVSLRAVNKFAPEELGCESTFASKITIPVLPLVADFKFEPTAACFPQNITVTENTATGDTMDWKVIDSNGRVAATSNASLPVFLITSPGKYSIILKTSNSFTGQVAFAPTTGKDVTIYENPVASFDVRPTLLYVPDTELTTFNFSTGAPEYLWDFGDGATSTEAEPKYTYKIEGNYDITLVAINDHGDGAVCTDTLARKITAKQGGVTKIPNAFTPSLGGPSGGVGGNNTFNDVFLPIVKGAEEFNMQIFDRWGNLLFESNNSNTGWDGYDKNGRLLPAGVYVYKLTVRLSDGQRSTQIGDITMIR